MNIFHTVMFLGCPLRWHPADDVRAMLEQKFAEKKIGVHTLRAALVHFVKRCLDDSAEQLPANRIQLGKRLDDVFRNGRFHQAPEARAVFQKWPLSPEGVVPIAIAAGVSETLGSLEDYRIEERFNLSGHQYPWNDMPAIQPGNEMSIHEPTVLDSFFYAAMLRMLSWPDDRAARGGNAGAANARRYRSDGHGLNLYPLGVFQAAER
jgi:hypothetical protein